MRNKRVLSLALPIAFALLVTFVWAAVEQSDNTAEPVPTNNGTSRNMSVAGRMQQYVGFYGNVSFEVRNDTSLGNVMYRKTVHYGKLFFFDEGDTPTEPFSAAPTTANTDGNFSLTGYYVTSNHFDTQDTVCNTSSVNKLNTTDNRLTGIFYDAAAPSNYFFCTEISAFTSTNGFGTLSYEIVVAKTSSYMSYDIWFDLAS
ncbi:hypothetical protein KJ765_00760 [Candidatus Micrarchaeota archaeon]|nr:hypothetical protein [Candidatus Micrarchaeota archaeon]